MGQQTLSLKEFHVQNDEHALDPRKLHLSSLVQVASKLLQQREQHALAQRERLAVEELVLADLLAEPQHDLHVLGHQRLAEGLLVPLLV